MLGVSVSHPLLSSLLCQMGTFYLPPVAQCLEMVDVEAAGPPGWPYLTVCVSLSVTLILLLRMVLRVSSLDAQLQEARGPAWPCFPPCPQVPALTSPREMCVEWKKGNEWPRARWEELLSQEVLWTFARVAV